MKAGKCNLGYCLQGLPLKAIGSQVISSHVKLDKVESESKLLSLKSVRFDSIQTRTDPRRILIDSKD